MKFDYEDIEIGILVELSNKGLICDGDNQVLRVISYDENNTER